MHVSFTFLRTIIFNFTMQHNNFLLPSTPTMVLNQSRGCACSHCNCDCCICGRCGVFFFYQHKTLSLATYLIPHNISPISSLKSHIYFTINSPSLYIPQSFYNICENIMVYCGRCGACNFCTYFVTTVALLQCSY